MADRDLMKLPVTFKRELMEPSLDIIRPTSSSVAESDDEVECTGVIFQTPPFMKRPSRFPMLRSYTPRLKLLFFVNRFSSQ